MVLIVVVGGGGGRGGDGGGGNIMRGSIMGIVERGEKIIGDRRENKGYYRELISKMGRTVLRISSSLQN